MKDEREMPSNALQTAAEASASAVATKTTYAGSIASISGWFLSSEVIALSGLVLAFLGFVVNLFFKIREDRRQQEAHRIAIENAERAAATNSRLDELSEVMRSGRQFSGYGGFPPPSKDQAPTDKGGEDDKQSPK